MPPLNAQTLARDAQWRAGLRAMLADLEPRPPWEPLDRVVPADAFWIGRRMMAILLISFWISVLVRSFAWLMLLGHNGLLNNALIAAGLITKARDGVKILGQGEIKAKLAFEVAAASKSAIAAIEGAGGSVKLLAGEAASA